jgi:hypothetical protein
MTRTAPASILSTITVAGKQVVLPPVAPVHIAEMKKAMKFAEKMSKGPTLYELLFPAN